MRLITTREWGANPSKEATRDSHPIGSTLGVTFHWTGPGFGWPWPHSRCFRLVRSIERHHEYGNGWGDIAYNLLPCPHGYVFEGRGVGVRSAANGYFEVNDDWYAVCYLGGVGDRFTAAGRGAMVDAVQLLREKGNAGPRVNGHRDHKSTTCPGDTIYDWLRRADFNQEEEMPNPKDYAEAVLDERVEIKRGDEIRTPRVRTVLRELEEEQDRQAEKLDHIIKLLEAR